MTHKIQKWFYINLEHRTDRRAHIESQFGAVGVTPQRIDAIADTNPTMGCTRSHIKALEEGIRQGWDFFGIVEDDYTIRDRDTFLSTICAAPSFDVFLGSTGMVDLKTEPYSGPYVKVWRSQTASCYVVTKEYAPILLANVKESLRLGQAHDQYWKILQPQSLWIGTKPALGHQREDYSDIQKQVVNYKC
jgi:GR25 family glycosyltransferase involved in LPS biosynthesis